MITQSQLFDEDFSKEILDPSRLAFIQDNIHLILKLRNRLLAVGVVLVMGTKQVSVGHLKYLIRFFPKSEHGLIMTDICPDDRQNFHSMSNLMEVNVVKMLEEHVADSEATVLYLKICSEISSSLYRIWHGLYFLRIWRDWLLKNKAYSLKENFITYNAYMCVEINAYFLIHLIVKLRDENRKEQFLPVFFSSQTCESTFRSMRSISTMNWTKINFSLLELCYFTQLEELNC